VVIPMLKKLKIRQTVSSFMGIHKSKDGTPTMGGIIFIIPTIISIIILILFHKLSITYNL
jgi:phospho-N-acetylmuramoyl-pentapeptide-transferase